MFCELSHIIPFLAEVNKYIWVNKNIAQSQTTSKWQSLIHLQAYLIPENLPLSQSYPEGATIQVLTLLLARLRVYLTLYNAVFQFAISGKWHMWQIL